MKPMPIFKRYGDGLVIDITRNERNYLVYIDPQGTKHAMCWENEHWVTACRIHVGSHPGSTYIPGQYCAPIDTRDLVMGAPTCIPCMAAEEGVPVPP